MAGRKRHDDIATPKGCWGTPLKLYNYLSKDVGGFDADAAANAMNHKHPVYFSESIDALRIDWQEAIEKKSAKFFLNPDYAKGVIDKFVKKAREEARKGATVTCLLPLSVDTGWWNREVMINDGKVAVEIRFIEGRVKFVGYTKSGEVITNSPPFCSCVVKFCHEHEHYWNQDRNPTLPILAPTIVLRDLR